MARKKAKPAKQKTEAAILDRQAAAVTLRVQGCTFRTIAGTLGVSLGQAHADVMAGLTAAHDQLAGRGSQLIALEDGRLDDGVRRVYRRLDVFEDQKEQPKPQDLASMVDVLRKLSESRRRLHGLNAAAKLDVKIDWSKLTDQELKFAEQLARKLV